MQRWYGIANDAIRIAGRAIEPDPAVPPSRHSFRGQSVEENREALRLAKDEVERAAAFTLVTAFERILREEVERRVQAAGLSAELETAILADAEYWSFEGRLVGAFEDVDAALRGNVKGLIKFRDWIAHGHVSTKPAPAGNVTVKAAHDLLTKFLQQAGIP